MSGGVDSSVAATLLQATRIRSRRRFYAHGEKSSQACELEKGKPNPLLPILQGRLDHKQGCCSASDAADARRVADKLGIPFYALDLEEDFKRIVDTSSMNTNTRVPPIRVCNATTGSNLDVCSITPMQSMPNM